MLKKLDVRKDSRVLSGIESSDDAGIYILNGETALVQTIDFITPIVDDPFSFGRIAAANSLSDIYAMGGTPLTVLNVCCFPVGKLEKAVFIEILKGAMSAVDESGAFLVGGHSIEDKELKFGLSVTGQVHPSKLWKNNTPKAGDSLVLTKPLGTGIISTAIKAGIASEADVEEIVASMSALNKIAAETAKKYFPSACTDVTGFGLIGHLSEMITGSGTGAEVQTCMVPLFSSVLDHASSGMIPGGGGANKKAYGCSVNVKGGIDDLIFEVLFDPQTSGGLLMALSDADNYVEDLVEKGLKASVIGRFTDRKGKIELV